MELTREQAQTMLLAVQGLHKRPTGPASKADVLAMIRQMGALQIDTIHVVARSPYFVLWSRLGDYDSRWLDELLAEGAIWEYWSHAACFLPIEDYPLYRRQMLDGLRGWQFSEAWLDEHGAALTAFVQQIRDGGPVRTSDFERTDGQTAGWWNWKWEKAVLEQLHSTGELMIVRRHNFQRIYDLRERVIPAWNDDKTPAHAEVLRAFVLKTVRALGITTARWVPDYFRLRKKGIAPLLDQLADEGELLRVAVDGWQTAAFVHRDRRDLLESVVAGTVRAELTTLLTPFDPVVWDRERASVMFGFDYRIECYTPAPRRVYGYFVLPILHRGKLVGRLDAKAHRAEGRFEVKKIFLEPGCVLTDELIIELAAALQECAAWHKTPLVDVTWSDPPELASQLMRAVETL